jgi:hypothetical protein
MSVDKPVIHIYNLVMCKGKTSPIKVHSKVVDAVFIYRIFQ